MELILIFIMFYVLGFLIVLIIWKIYSIKKEKDKKIEKERFENEVINSLLELKKYTIKNLDVRKLSNKYDLIEVALENEVISITIASDEGLPILSTLKDPYEESAKYSAIFQNISKSLNNNPSRLSIEYDEGYYVHITPIIKYDNILYIIVKSNMEINTITEKNYCMKYRMF